MQALPRVWNVREKQWENFDLYWFEENFIHYFEDLEPGYTISFPLEIFDDDNKEIYVGDIVEYTYKPIGSNPEIIRYSRIGQVLKFGFVSWKIEETTVVDPVRALSHYKNYRGKYLHPTAGENWIDTAQLHLHRARGVRVVGNIYENPELLNAQPKPDEPAA